MEHVVGAVVVAAGLGRRLNAPVPKALFELDGVTLVEHAVQRMRSVGGLATVVVVYTPGARDAFELALRAHDVTLVPGGASRTASVREGVAALPSQVDVVAVHDAARAFTPPEVIAASIDAVVGSDGEVLAAAPGLAVTDTLKRVADAEVVGTVPRDGLVAIQTPQVVRRAVLELAFEHAPQTATDDLGLVERLRDQGRVDGQIVVVPGATAGLKVTYPEDIVTARRLAAVSTRTLEGDPHADR